MYRGNYVTDAGKTYFFVSLSVFANDSFLPAIFKNNASQGAGFCALPSTVKPREALLFDVSGDEHRIQYPFYPGSSEWLEFWDGINQNSGIITARSVGERVQLNLRNL